MKKISFVLSVAICTISFIGCGGGGGDSQDITNNIYTYKEDGKKANVPDQTPSQIQNQIPNNSSASSNLSTTSYQPVKQQEQDTQNNYHYTDSRYYSDQDIMMAMFGHLTQFAILDRKDLGDKIIILSRFDDHELYVYGLEKRADGLHLINRNHKIVLNLEGIALSDVSVWINSVDGNNVNIGYRHKDVGNNEHIVYDFVHDRYVSNTTDGAGSSDYTWDEYEMDHR